MYRVIRQETRPSVNTAWYVPPVNPYIQNLRITLQMVTTHVVSSDHLIKETTTDWLNHDDFVVFVTDPQVVADVIDARNTYDLAQGIASVVTFKGEIVD